MTHEKHPDSAEDGHQHDAGGSHDHEHEHSHGGRSGKVGAALREVFAPHSHDASDSIDGALESSAAGIRAVKISLLALGATEVHWDKRPPDADYVILADPEGNRFCVVDITR